jgi:hypothetical protein
MQLARQPQQVRKPRFAWPVLPGPRASAGARKSAGVACGPLRHARTSQVARAAELGMPALAVTDHEGLYGAVRFYQACKAAGIKPIIGVELTVEPAVGRDGRPKWPGEAQPDFQLQGRDVHGLDGLVALFGIESPGLTSSLAIGEAVSEMLADD